MVLSNTTQQLLYHRHYQRTTSMFAHLHIDNGREHIYSSVFRLSVKNSFSRGRSFFLKSILFAIGRYSRANWFISLSLKYPSYLIPSGLIIVKGHVCIWSYAVPTHVTEHGCPRYFLSGSLRTISFAIVLQNALFSVSPFLCLLDSGVTRDKHKLPISAFRVISSHNCAVTNKDDTVSFDKWLFFTNEIALIPAPRWCSSA